jgi:glycosyltransferase involved in cell wall biosynthesis
MQGAEAGIDPGFGVQVKWDIPLLDGYPWICLPNRWGKPKLGSFFGLFNPGIWKLISRGNFDAVVLYTGYIYATFWIAIAAAKTHNVPVLFGTDSTALKPRDGKRWKVAFKRFLLPAIFRLADVVVMPSEAGRQFMLGMGIAEARVSLTPFVVDNAWWEQRASEVDRGAVRQKWDIPEEAVVALFCAKLQPWKRPQDLLAAFAHVADRNVYLVLAGEGPLRPDLESEAHALGIAANVRFLGFVNQSGLPETYTGADILVLPSEYEPFGLVVNEAMLCRCPVIVSDRVGARFDLVKEGETGYVFPCGDIHSLASVLRLALNDRPRLRRMGEAARKRMASWSPADYVNALVESVSTAAGVRNEAKITASA